MRGGRPGRMPRRSNSWYQTLPGYRKQRRTLTRVGMVRLSRKAYSLPSRLRREQVHVRQPGRNWHLGGLLERHEQAHAKRAGVFYYRHLVGAQLRKPGA
ncbi:MAG: hypothetical protein OXN89_01605 [Bryobacterales bacterium]|nr:hypothetical protein [Bryobacterales bacterium]